MQLTDKNIWLKGRTILPSTFQAISVRDPTGKATTKGAVSISRTRISIIESRLYNLGIE